MLRPGHLGYPGVVNEVFFCSVMLLHVQIIGMWLLYDYSVHSI